MFVSESSNTLIDSVFIAKGEFQWNQANGQIYPEITLMAAYSNKSTGATFGTCPVKTALLRPETVNAFAEFVKMAEEDFGRLVFDNVGSAQIGLEHTPPEDNTGLKGIGGK